MKTLWFRNNDDGMYQQGFRIFDGEGERNIYADTFSEEAAHEIVNAVNGKRIITIKYCRFHGEKLLADGTCPQKCESLTKCSYCKRHHHIETWCKEKTLVRGR